MVNLHTCHVCGESVYFIPNLTNIGRVKSYTKMNPDTRKPHVCNGSDKEFESFYQEHDLSARKYTKRGSYPPRRSKKF